MPSICLCGGLWFQLSRILFRERMSDKRRFCDMGWIAKARSFVGSVVFVQLFAKLVYLLYPDWKLITRHDLDTINTILTGILFLWIVFKCIACHNLLRCSHNMSSRFILNVKELCAFPIFCCIQSRQIIPLLLGCWQFCGRACSRRQAGVHSLEESSIGLNNLATNGQYTQPVGETFHSQIACEAIELQEMERAETDCQPAGDFKKA